MLSKRQRAITKWSSSHWFRRDRTPPQWSALHSGKKGSLGKFMKTPARSSRIKLRNCSTRLWVRLAWFTFIVVANHVFLSCYCHYSRRQGSEASAVICSDAPLRAERSRDECFTNGILAISAWWLSGTCCARMWHVFAKRF